MVKVVEETLDCIFCRGAKVLEAQETGGGGGLILDKSGYMTQAPPYS